MAISRAGSRFYDMTEELKTLFTSEESVLADLLSDEIGGNKVASLHNISQALNTVKRGKHEKNENTPTSADSLNYWISGLCPSSGILNN
jgi:hypothetical protein